MAEAVADTKVIWYIAGNQAKLLASAASNAACQQRTLHTIAILSQKGGTGKTTLTLHLAVASELAGQPTAFIDLDPQASAAGWKDSRSAETPVVVPIPSSRLPRAMDAARAGGAALTLIDTAPHATEVALAAAEAADLVLIPCQAGILDLRAIGMTARAIKLAAKPAYVVLNAMPPRAPNVLADARAAVAVHGLEVAPVTMHQRVAYAHSLTAGQTAQEYEPAGKAAEEIAQLYTWLQGKLGCSIAALPANRQTGRDGAAMSKRPSLAETMRQAAAADAVPLQSPQVPAPVITAHSNPPGPFSPERHFYAATRAGKKKVTATLAPSDHKRLRQLALERGATTEALPYRGHQRPIHQIWQGCDRGGGRDLVIVPCGRTSGRHKGATRLHTMTAAPVGGRPDCESGLSRGAAEGGYSQADLWSLVAPRVWSLVARLGVIPWSLVAQTNRKAK